MPGEPPTVERARTDDSPCCADSAHWVSVAEAADHFHISVNLVYKLLEHGTFPARTLRIGNTWRIDLASVRLAQP